MTNRIDGEGQFYQCLRMALINFVRGAPPLLAVESTGATKGVAEHIR